MLSKTDLLPVRYRNEFLLPVVRPHAGAFGDGFILMDDYGNKSCALNLISTFYDYHWVDSSAS